jgi:hypothetical protein
MRILEDGTVEIRSNKGNVKVVKPEELPSYGIDYTDYQSQLEAYKSSIKGEQPKEKADPFAPQKKIAGEALGLLETRYGRGDAQNVGTGQDISLAGSGSILERILSVPAKWVSSKEKRNDIKSYENLLETFLPTFTQAFGSGAPQEGEAKRLLKSAPNARSSDEEAKRWFSDVRSLLTGQTSGSVKTSSGNQYIIKQVGD